MLLKFMYIILIILLGYVLKRLHILEEKDGEVISKIIFKITLPALVLVTFDSVKIEVSLMLIPVLVIIYGILITILGILLFKNEEKELKGTFLMLASGFNVGLFAFPLVFVIWGMNGITYFSMFDIGTSVITFGIAYLLGSYFSNEGLQLKPKEIVKKLGKSIPLMTYLLAAILNFSHIKLPDIIIHLADTLSQANTPLSLLLLGIYLNFTFEKDLLRPVAKFISFRYGFGLLMGIVLFIILPFDEMFRYTLVIGFLLPAAASSLTFAIEFKYSDHAKRLMATISNISILVSIITFYLFTYIL